VRIITVVGFKYFGLFCATTSLACTLMEMCATCASTGMEDSFLAVDLSSAIMPYNMLFALKDLKAITTILVFFFLQ
jgi:hypothetical protein